MKLDHPLDVALLNVTRKHTRPHRCVFQQILSDAKGDALRDPNVCHVALSEISGQIAYSYAMTAKQ